MLLIPKELRTTTSKLSWFLLLCVLLGSMVSDIAWISKLTRQLIFPYSYKLHIFIVRCSWAAMVIQYQSLALFVESIVYKKYRPNLRQYITSTMSTVFSFYFVYIAFFDNNITDEIDRHKALSFISLKSPLEAQMIACVALYILVCVMLPALYFSSKAIKTKKLPRLLQKQLTIFINYFLYPFLFIECSISFNILQRYEDYRSIILGISSLLVCFSIFYCIRAILRLRFLNMDKELYAPKRANFVDEFKETLDQLSKVNTIAELSHITQHFFKKSFNVSPKKVSLIVRNEQVKVNTQQLFPIEQFIEDFMCNHTHEICSFIKKSQILMYDELSFNNFYENDPYHQTCIQFLETINADLFIPIYQKQKVIAYIVIEANARPKKLYTPVEHDEILVFANYLGNIINLLQNRNIDLLTAQERELAEELHHKDQEIMHYKESMRSFLRINNHNEVGILFYKNRRIVFGNQAAKEIIKINVNVQEGHPLSKAIHSLGRKVEEYNAQQTIYFTNQDGKEIIISGIPNLEQNNVIITLSHPEMSDVIKKQLSLLKDPTKWDYLLYLETTKTGQLINQLIPGGGEILLNFKIDLLKLSMSNKALLLDTADHDADDMAELLHHAGLRDTFHKLNLTKPATTNDYTIKLFGISPVFGIKTAEKPLFELLSSAGTLFIKNINFLDQSSQEHLLEYLKTGFWRMYKSDQKKPGNIGIVCTSSENLTLLVEEKRFSKALYDELKTTSLSMPPLSALPSEELHALTEGFSAQNRVSHKVPHLLELNEKDKNKLIATSPTSLFDIKKQVQELLLKKLEKHAIYKEAIVSPVTSDDPELIHAASMGKQALRDEQIMIMLWNKFKNQNQIASFLGVNRSSVNRRCKAYNLG